MPDVGYRVWIDLSDTSGDFTIGLAGGYQGTLTPCSQFAMPLSVK
jgi:hypothetical protein